jgi:2-amino-4-hydroxy-6-hydroxymethyldihydropteridine diphosphokinase
VLLLGEVEHRSERLTLPHRDVLNRRFVLLPLLELDPSLRLPDGTSLADAAERLEGQRVERVGRL